MSIKKFNDFDEINESAPIDKLENDFKQTAEFKAIKGKADIIVAELTKKFYKHCEKSGHENPEGDSDIEMTLDNLLSDLVSRYE